MLDIYEVLSYDFHKSDSEIFAMPMCRVNALLEHWVKDMRRRNKTK